MFWLVVTFIICTGAIVWAGAKLSVNCDRFAVMTGLGRVWIGMTAVAVTTSLPELFTGASAILYAGSVNIALGDALGSCVFNLLILAMVDYLTPNHAMHSRLGPCNLLSAAFSIVIVATIALGIALQPFTPLTLLHMGIVTPLILVVYALSSRLTYVYERNLFPEHETHMVETRELAGTIYRILFCAAVVAVAGTFLPKIGVQLADQAGLGRGFVGSVFIAVSTSLPEVVVAISAVRIGAQDIAVGNIFGSNLFNCVIIAIDDILFTDGPVYALAAPGQLITASIVLIMSGIAVVGLYVKSKSISFLGIGWDSTLLILFYLLNIVTSYYLGGGV